MNRLLSQGEVHVGKQPHLMRVQLGSASFMLSYAAAEKLRDQLANLLNEATQAAVTPPAADGETKAERA